jgi:hypothetical protein
MQIMKALILFESLPLVSSSCRECIGCGEGIRVGVGGVGVRER